MNPLAGPSRVPSAEAARRALAAVGAAVTIVEVGPAEVPAAAGRAARGGRTVGVAGGDGTLSGAAPAVAAEGGLLLPIPLGTRNHFARRLGIDSPEAAAHALGSGREVRVPIGTANGRAFINHASAGLYPRVVFHRERIRRWTGKSLGTALAGAYALLRLETITLSLRVDGERRDRTVAGLWIALGRGAFRLPIDGALPEGGRLEVVLPLETTRAGILARGVRAIRHLRGGGSIEDAGLEVMHAAAFTLEARQAVDVSRDGEVERLEPPIVFEIEPAALRVLSLAP